MARSQPRTVDAPPRTSCSTRQAALWLGWSVDTFKRVVTEEAAWLRPIGVRTSKGGDLWSWRQLIALAIIYEVKPLPTRAAQSQSKREKST